MTELEAFIRAVGNDPEGNPTRLMFADWIDEHFPATKVDLHEIPKGFRRYYLRKGLYRVVGRQLGDRGNPSNSDIANQILNLSMPEPRIGRAFDHFGASVIDGHHVLVGEPYWNDEMALECCPQAQRFFGCPVSFGRKSYWASEQESGTKNIGGTGCRILVWFTFAS